MLLLAEIALQIGLRSNQVTRPLVIMKPIHERTGLPAMSCLTMQDLSACACMSLSHMLSKPETGLTSLSLQLQPCISLLYRPEAVVWG